MYDVYFTVTLKDGTYIDFNKKCVQIQEFSTNGRMICFKEIKDNNNSRVLCIINVDEIKLIDSCIY